MTDMGFGDTTGEADFEQEIVFLSVEQAPSLHTESIRPGVAIYHRTLTTLLNTLIANALTITVVGEPSASDETIARLPEYASTRRFAPFLLVASRKGYSQESD